MKCNIVLSRGVVVGKSKFDDFPTKFETFVFTTNQKKVKVLPAPMAYRATPISVSVALGQTSANAVKATAGGWSTGSSACLTFPFHSHMSSTK